MASFAPIINAALGRNFDALDFLLEMDDISRIEKIEALELAGAAILCKFNRDHLYLFPKGFDYWRKSIQLRSIDTDGCSPVIKKLPENLKKTGMVVEWATPEELERVIQNPSEHEIQSFLVQSRILSAKSWDAVNNLFAFYIDDMPYFRIPYQMEDDGKSVYWLNIQWSMLEIIRRFDPQQNGLWLTTLKVVTELMFTLPTLQELGHPLLNSNTIEISLGLILATDQFHLEDQEDIAYHLLFSHFIRMSAFIKILAENPHLINEGSMESLCQLVPRNKRCCPRSGMLLLHKASTNSTHSGSLATVELLLRAGADPNAGDRNDNGPLHYLAEFFECPDTTAQLLMDYGAHLDRANKDRKTPAEVWLEKWHSNLSLPNWLRENSARKLKCLCARTIRSNGVPYAHLPRVLKPFVAFH